MIHLPVKFSIEMNGLVLISFSWTPGRCIYY
jgi:hypothetical protein